MTFEKLWEHQQGAVFLKKDEIYEHRKSLAEFFYNEGAKFAADQSLETIKKLTQEVKDLEEELDEMIEDSEVPFEDLTKEEQAELMAGAVETFDRMKAESESRRRTKDN